MYVSLLFVLAMFLFSLRSVGEKILTKTITVETMLLVIICLNVIIGLVMYLVVVDKKRVHADINTLVTSENAPTVWLILTYVSIIGVLFAYIYYYLIKTHKLYYVNLLLATFPVFIVVSGYIFLNERITVRHIVSMIVIILGVMLLEYDNEILS